MPFSPPEGVTFQTGQEIAVTDLCAVLRRVAVFLQGLQLSSPPLRLYHDWWQHDGLHFDRRAIAFHDLFAMVETPRAIFEATPDDHEVFVGVAPEDAGWYLRFRAEWDADDRSIVGSFAVTVPSELAPAFTAEVGASSQHRLVEEAAGRYYERVSFLLPLIAAALCAGCSTTSSPSSDASSGMTTEVSSEDRFAQIRSTGFDPNGVTPRRLVSHTAGLTVHGFKDYEQGVPLPSLVEVLEGKNQDDGAVFINWEPGTTNVYSGGGFVIAQMIIEDVSGEPFAEFMRREVAKPMGLSSLEWVWTPRLERRAPTPYDHERKEVGYRQLAAQAIGSEICTVPDFARFIAAAAVTGPNNERPGRGVLKPETIATMLQTQPNVQPSGGLGYGVGSVKEEKFLLHAGANPGWHAFFLISGDRREGFVIANNSSRGGAVNDAVTKLWLKACRGIDVEREQH